MSDSDNPPKRQATSRLRVVERPEFLATANLSKTGSLVADSHNAALFLEEPNPGLPNQFYFQYDEMMQRIVVGEDLHPLAECDIDKCRRWLLAPLKKIPVDEVRAAIRMVADGRRFNPLTHYLRGLVWDRIPRLHKWLHLFLGTPDDEYHATIGTLFLRALVRRIEEPGCKSDYMLVLEGPQRHLKSTVCGVLGLVGIPELNGGRGYFSDSLPDLAGDPVRVAMHLRGKIVCEVSEMHSMARAEASRLKQFLSSPVEQYTPKYGRVEVHEPRTVLFVGTTNKSTYLIDETGGTRFWPVKCGEINIEALRQWYPQLLAEAYWQVIVERKKWWPEDGFQQKVIGPVQDSRYEASSWETSIADWDFCLPPVDGNGVPLRGDDATAMSRQVLYAPYYLRDIALGALGIEKKQLQGAPEKKLLQTLEFMGWRRANRTRRGVPWVPPEDDVGV